MNNVDTLNRHSVEEKLVVTNKPIFDKSEKLNNKFSFNKKLWSFNFGCLIAYSFMWLVGFGNSAPVPEVLHPHPLFILDYYSGLVTACAALMLTALTIIIMNKGFNLCTSEHPFWLVLPSMTFLALTTVSAFEMLSTILYAAIPALFLLCITAVIMRLARQKMKAREFVR